MSMRSPLPLKFVLLKGSSEKIMAAFSATVYLKVTDQKLNIELICFAKIPAGTRLLSSQQPIKELT